MKTNQIVIGVDEVGRGPLAGPLAVGALMLDAKHRAVLRGVRDSKKLTPEARDIWYRKIRALEREGKLVCKVAFVSARTIDQKGISHALRRAVGSCLRRLGATARTAVVLDGALYAPAFYVRQRTIVRGDEKHAVIAAASIMAKVRRDRRMRALSKRYPRYRFDLHKGYGTREHYGVLRKFGPSEIHRMSFLRRLYG